MTREEAIKWLKIKKCEKPICEEAINMAIEALSADAVSREEHEEVKAYMDTLVDAFIEDGEELAESVKVVRCKDCRHSRIEGDTTMFMWCGYLNKPTDGTRYCSDGERSE